MLSWEAAPPPEAPEAALVVVRELTAPEILDPAPAPEEALAIEEAPEEMEAASSSLAMFAVKVVVSVADSGSGSGSGGRSSKYSKLEERFDKKKDLTESAGFDMQRYYRNVAKHFFASDSPLGFGMRHRCQTMERMSLPSASLISRYFSSGIRTGGSILYAIKQTFPCIQGLWLQRQRTITTRARRNKKRVLYRNCS